MDYHDKSKEELINELVKLENANAKTENKYKFLIENINDIIYEYDQQGVLKYISPVVEKTFGFTPEDIIGRNFIHFVGKSEEYTLKVLNELREKKEINTEYEIYTKDGQIRWANLSTKAVFEGGKFMGGAGTVTDITERKRIETERNQNELLYRSILNASPDTITITDLEGKILFSSSSAYKMFGYDSSFDFSNHSNLEFLDTADREKAKAAIQRMLHNEFNGADEYTGIKADGSKFEIEVNGEFIRDTEGKPVNMIFVTRDITNRKLLEAKLLKSEEKYRQLVENINEVIYEIDKEGIVKYVSPAIQKMGYLPEEMIGQSFLNFTGEHAETLHGNFLNIGEAGEISNEYELLSKTGEAHWLRISTKAMYQHGEFTGGSGTLVDITERKSIELALQKSEEKYRNMVERINDVLFEVTSEGVIKYVSPTIYKVMGYTAEELMGKNFFSCMYPEDKPVILQALANLANRDSSDLEYRYYVKDGSIRWVRSSTKPIFEKGKVVGGIGVLIDINERKLAEEKLIQSELRYKTFFEDNNSIMMLIDPDSGDIMDANPAACQYYGWTHPELCRMNISQINTLSMDEITAEMKLAQMEERRQFFFRHLLANGEIRDVEVYSGPMKFGASTLLYSIVHDITKRNQAEESILRANRLRSVISNINLAIIKEKSKEKLLAEVCNIAVNFGKFQMVWIGLFDMDSKNVSPYIIEGKEDRYFSIIQQISIENVAEGRGPTGNAIRDGKPFICNDIEHDPAMSLWKNEALIRNYRSSIALPLKQFGNVFGAITLYSSLVNFFNTEEVELMVEVVDNINNAIEAIEIETERKRVENELRKLYLAVRQSPVSVVITNMEGDIEFVNPAFEEITGYSFEEVKNKNTRMLKSGKNDESIYPELWSTIKGGSVWEKDWINKKKNGDYYWEHIAISPVYDEKGSIMNFLAIKQDITKRKENEQEIRELNTNLEKKIMARTSELESTNASLLNEINKRKSIEDALTKSEYQYRSVVENIHEVIFQTDPDGLWVFLNQSWEDVTGFSVEESLGRFFLEYIHPNDRQRNMDLFEPLLMRKKEYCRHEIRYLTKDGGFRWIEVYARLGLNEQDEIIGTYGTLYDITERKRVENELEQLSTRLELAVRAGGIGVWDLDLENNILYWDNQMLELYGVEKENFIGAYEAWLIGLHPDDKERGDAEIQAAISGEKEFDTEFRVVRPNGTIRNIRALAVVERDDSGKPIHLIGTNWDITDQKKAAEAIIVEKQRLADIIIGTNVGTWEWDIRTGEILINERFSEIMGYTLTEITPLSNMSWLTYVHPDDLNILLELSRKHLKGESDYFDLELRVKHKNGEWVWVSDRGKAHELDNDGKALIMSGTIKDITSRKSAEEEARQSRIEVENANIAKSEFLSRMSHELRTPMNSILGFAQLLELGELNKSQKRGVNHIMKSGKHLLSLINEVLDISRIEAGHMSISIEPIKTRSIIEETIDILRPQAIKQQIKLEFTTTGTEQLFVKSDRQGLMQILLNLLSNAIKYNKVAGSVFIKTQLIPDNEGLGFIRISITDTGIGIAQEDVLKLFTPFERIGAVKTQIEGTGLGLAVVKKLVEVNEGHLGVESVQGEGSTFWVELPVAENKVETIHKSELMAGQDSNLNQKKGTILYIEDNVSNIELVEQILTTQRPGIKLVTGMYGKETTKLAVENIPQLILLDLNLPDIHGNEVLSLLLKNEQTKDIPVVVISADAMNKQIETLMLAGAKRYLTKPLEIVEFLRMIDEFIPDSI